ncbi:MAG: phosphoribosyltransferase, partial [Actinobacteria bacterium]|nr:phosphoribosyltransferase [Actinomycetota bacterium]
MFTDRTDAGKILARALINYKNKDVLVLAIPRGGVEVAYEVAKFLNADLDLIVSRKLPLPYNREAGFGAIAEDGSTFIFKDAYNWLDENEIERIKKEQKDEIKRRIKILREGRPLSEIKDRIVILIDDGLAMGSTMRAAINLCKEKKAKKIIVAVPVAGTDVAGEIREIVDELVVLEMPAFFQAVAQVYVNWHDATDSEVIEILKKFKKESKN